MHEFKELTCDKPIEDAKAPSVVTIALHQHIGAPCEPLVKAGDHVLVGQKIGESGARISAPVHASVSGNVKKIVELMTPAGVMTKGIVIESDGLFEDCFPKEKRNFREMTPDEIVEAVREGGVIGLGGAGFPTSVKILPNQEPLDEVIINCAECEPYLTSDQVMMEAFPEKVVGGLEIVMYVMGARKGYLAIENNKPRAIQALKNASENYPDISVSVLKTKYPQGDQKRIIDAVTKKITPSGAHATDIGTQVINATTAIAIYDAVVWGRPITERVITVTGHALKEPKNLRVPIGTSLSEVLENCEGFKEKPGKIVMGGPMMGEAQFSIEAPTIKALGGLLVLTEREAAPKPVTPCIKCGKCVSVCPVYLLPINLHQMALKNKLDQCQKLHIMDCIECGSCSYVCPAKRPLVESIRMGKKEVRDKERKNR